jgi:hypothetical protein
MAQRKTFQEIDAAAERVGVIGSPSSTAGITADIMGHSVDKKLVGALTYFTFQQGGKRHCALGQVTEILLKNPWVEGATMRSLIRDRGRVDPLTARQDTHTAALSLGAVFSEGPTEFDQAQMGTVPPTGTDVKLVDNPLLDHLLADQVGLICKVGRIYGTQTLFPVWFRHFGQGKGGADETYHYGIFGKTGSGKSTLAQVMMLGFAAHREMTIIVLDPQGEFSRQFKEGKPAREFIEKVIGRRPILVNVNKIWLNDNPKTFSLFLELLERSRFLDQLVIRHPDNRAHALAEIRKLLIKPPKPTLDEPDATGSPRTCDIHERKYFDRVWNGLSTEQVQKRIYSGEKYSQRIADQIAVLDRDDVFAIWQQVARLFTATGRPGSLSSNELADSVLDTKRGSFIVVDLSEESAPDDLFWDEQVKFRVLRKLIDDIVLRGEDEFKAERKVNTIVFLDEAHRFAPREDPDPESELARLKHLLADAARTTRKYGIGWCILSQTLHSIDRELAEQLRVYVFGYGLGWGAELRALEDFVAGTEGIRLYQTFRDPETSIRDKAYPFMVIGPFSPLSFSGAPLFFTALHFPEESLNELGKFATGVGEGSDGRRR